MAWTTWPMATGLTDDGAMEAQLSLSESTHITCASGINTHPLDANAKKCLIHLYDSAIQLSKIGSVSAHIAVDAGISSDIGLLTDGAQADTKKWLRIAAADRKIKVCDYLGNIKASSTSQVSTNTAALTEIVAIFDVKTLSTVWVAVVIDGTEEIALDTGMTPAQFGLGGVAFGDWSAAGSNMGAKLYSRYVIMRNTTTAGDAPHVAAYPRLKGAGGFALTSLGDLDQWSHDSASSVTDIATNDGDTGRVYHIENDPVAAEKKNLYHWSAANPFSGGETIVGAQAKHVGKLSSAGKNYAANLLKYSGTEQKSGISASPTTAYEGHCAHITTAPGGGAWATSHWDLTGGVSDMQVGGQSNKSAGADTAAVWTYGRGVEAVYYTASLGLTTTPVAAATRRIFVC